MALDYSDIPQATTLTGSAQQPDAPFRIGASGKYLLLVKHVEHKFDHYEYELYDADGRIYQAESAQKYPENQLLRCVVTFMAKDARLVVMSTVICKKQDHIIAVSKPEPNKESVDIERTATSAQQQPLIEGSPRRKRRTGLYRLTVDLSISWPNSESKSYLYLLLDEGGYKYHSVSNKNYAKGTRLLCKVEILKAYDIDVFFVSVSEDESSQSVCMINHQIVLRKDFKVEKSTKQTISSPKKPKEKRKKAGVDLIYLRAKYSVGERYPFIVTGEKDKDGYQLLRDQYGYEHPLTGTTVEYSRGDEVRCMVSGFSQFANPTTGKGSLILTSPRIVNKEKDDVYYIRSPYRWHSEVQDLGRHKCGKPFTCSCCGRDFPANAGVRVDFKEIYFCNSCARKVYEPVGRGNRHVVILTPMGNKR